MGVREVDIAEYKLIINELEDLYDSVTGRALTGSWVWDSALVLSRWMLTHARLHYDFNDKTVLELGAGTGIPGLTAALLGAGRVILTDIGPLVPGLVKNVEANGLGDRVEVSELVWGSDELPTQLGESVKVDLVLMSDVFYDVAEMAGLAKTLKMVCGSETRLWASSEVRPLTGDSMTELRREGFEVVEVTSEVSQGLASEVSGGYGEVFEVYQLKPPYQEWENMRAWTPLRR